MTIIIQYNCVWDDNGLRLIDGSKSGRIKGIAHHPAYYPLTESRFDISIYPNLTDREEHG